MLIYFIDTVFSIEVNQVETSLYFHGIVIALKNGFLGLKFDSWKLDRFCDGVCSKVVYF